MKRYPRRSIGRSVRARSCAGPDHHPPIHPHLLNIYNVAVHLSSRIRPRVSTLEERTQATQHIRQESAHPPKLPWASLLCELIPPPSPLAKGCPRRHAHRTKSAQRSGDVHYYEYGEKGTPAEGWEGICGSRMCWRKGATKGRGEFIDLYIASLFLPLSLIYTYHLTL